MSDLTLTVTQLNTYIKNIFDAEEMLFNIKVVGEITNLKPSTKAVYFDLKDENASIPCVCFIPRALASFSFGDKVTVKGKLNYYIKGGKLSLIVDSLEKFGQGDLYREYLELKEKLQAKGRFDIDKKKPLPIFPKRIGVVTSNTGAVIRDIIRVARSKNRTTDIVLMPAKVQGIGAKEEIIKGIEVLDDYGVDIIIVARGGGSFEDYQPFNSEEVSEAVFKAKTPIISAIGHENDWSLIDFVADKRASTPSVASEMAFYSEYEYFESLRSHLETAFKLKLKNLSLDLQKISGSAELMEKSIKSRLASYFNTISHLEKDLVNSMDKIVDEKLQKTNLLSLELEKSNPLTILNNGYARIKKACKPIMSIEEISVGDNVKVNFKDGSADAVIQAKEEKNYGLHKFN